MIILGKVQKQALLSDLQHKQQHVQWLHTRQRVGSIAMMGLDQAARSIRHSKWRPVVSTRTSICCGLPSSLQGAREQGTGGGRGACDARTPWLSMPVLCPV